MPGNSRASLPAEQSCALRGSCGPVEGCVEQMWVFAEVASLRNSSWARGQRQGFRNPRRAAGLQPGLGWE